MRKRPTLLLFLFAWAATETAMMPSAEAQNLLDRLETRVRERLSSPDAPQPAPPPSLQSPPLQSGLPADVRSPANSPPTLGLEAEERGPAAPYEVVVNMVRPGSAAAQAGIRPGDVILSVDGREVGSIADISSTLRSKRSGESLRIAIRRGNQRIDAEAWFAEASNPPGYGNEMTEPGARGPAVVERPPAGSGRIGVTVENADTTPPGAGVPVQRGAVVVAVAPGSPAAVAGIQPGNVVVAIDGRVVQNAAGLIEEMGATVPGQQIEVSFYRGESLVRIPLRLAGEDGLAMGPAPGEARLGTPTGSESSGGNPPRGVLGGLGQAIGGIFGGTAAPPAAVPGTPAMKIPAGEPATAGARPSGDAPALGDALAPAPPSPSSPPASSSPAASADSADASQPTSDLEPAGPLQPVSPSPAAAPGGFAAPDESAAPDNSAAPDRASAPTAAAAETIPLPADGPEEVRQLLDKLQAMQRRIDVLERRLAEIEAAKAQP